MTKTKEGRVMRFDGETLTITDERGKTERYAVQAIHDEGGEVLLGCRLTKKSDGEAYDVELAEERCHCLGALRWGRGCKHLAAVKKLVELDLIG